MPPCLLILRLFRYISTDFHAMPLHAPRLPPGDMIRHGDVFFALRRCLPRDMPAAAILPPAACLLPRLRRHTPLLYYVVIDYAACFTMAFRCCFHDAVSPPLMSPPYAAAAFRYFILSFCLSLLSDARLRSRCRLCCDAMPSLLPPAVIAFMRAMPRAMLAAELILLRAAMSDTTPAPACRYASAILQSALRWFATTPCLSVALRRDEHDAFICFDCHAYALFCRHCDTQLLMPFCRPFMLDAAFDGCLIS